jgi:hypothetical protein
VKANAAFNKLQRKHDELSAQNGELRTEILRLKLLHLRCVEALDACRVSDAQDGDVESTTDALMKSVEGLR